MSAIAAKKKGPMHLQNVKVVVRVRPLSKQEEEHNTKNIIKIQTHKDLTLKEKKYTFDRVFKPSSTQIELYLNVIAPLIQDVVAGYNCTVFAYGQTGSGKTFTMSGDKCNMAGNWRDDDDAGIIPRAAFNIFEELHKLPKAELSVKVSYIELYNEEIRDLLSDDENSLNLFSDTKGNLFIQGLTEISVLDGQGICKLLQRGIVKRQIAPTLMNHQSSRSHTVFIISVNIIERTPAGGDVLKAGKINLVDLAGSENIARSGCKDLRAMELANINRSLLTLGRVIHALADKSLKHVPYRDSKLTRILQDSLGGHTKTAIIATVSPAHNSYEETASTLDYATRAKDIKNTPIINEKLTKNDVLDGLVKEIDRLQKDLDAARSGTGFYVNKDNFQQMLDAVMAVTGEVITAEELEGKKVERLHNLEQLAQMRMKQFEDTVKQCKKHEKELVEAKNVIKELEHEKFLASWYENESNEKYLEAQNLLHATNILNNEKEILLAKLENQFSINMKNHTITHTAVQNALDAVDNFGTSKKKLITLQQSEIELKYDIDNKRQNLIQSLKNMSEEVSTIDRNAFQNISVHETMHPLVQQHISTIQNKIVTLEEALTVYCQNIQNFEKLFSELSNSYEAKIEELFAENTSDTSTHNNNFLNDLNSLENILLEERKRQKEELQELRKLVAYREKDIERNELCLNHIVKMKDNIKTANDETDIKTKTQMKTLKNFTSDSIKKLEDQVHNISQEHKKSAQEIESFMNLVDNFVKQINNKFIDLDNSQKQITEELYNCISQTVVNNCIQLEKTLDGQTDHLMRNTTNIIVATESFIKSFDDFILHIKHTLVHQILEQNVRANHAGDTPIRQSVSLPNKIKEMVPRAVLVEKFKISATVKEELKEEEEQQ